MFHKPLSGPNFGPWAGLRGLLGGVVRWAPMAQGTIARFCSEHQQVELFREPEGALGLTLDGWWQFHEDEEAEFHAMLADVPMTVASRVQRVLILGGGDGLVARNVLRYPGVERVDLVELDAAVLELARRQPDLLALSAASLCDPRVRVHVEDARAFLARDASSVYDVILCDFPVATHGALGELFTAEFYRSLRPWAAPNAVVGVQVSQLAPGFWRVRDALAGTFARVEGYLARLSPPGAPEESWGSFLVGSGGPVTQCRPAAVELGVPWSEVLAGRRVVSTRGPHLRTAAYGAGPEPEPEG